MKRKILLLIICVIMLIPANIMSVSADAISANEMYQKFQELKKKYPEGSTWTGSYNNLSRQCMGWAETVCDYLFNENPRNWEKKTNWDKVCVGDHVRINNDGHSIVITNIIGDTIYYADCNAGWTNQVHWDKTMSRSELASKGTWRKTQAGNGIRPDITPSTVAPIPKEPVIKANAEYAKESTSVTVSWDKDSNAVKYEYFLAEYPKAYAYTTNSDHGFTTDTSVKFSNLTCGNYSVFIHGISKDGERSKQSNWVTFEINADDYVPAKVVTYNNHIYALYENATSWTYADELCVALGGHLATVTSSEENAVISDLIQAGSGAAYWLGATDKDSNEKDFKWVTGEKFSYDNWKSGEPSSSGEKGTKESFLEVRKSYNNQWNDVKNISKKGFILEIDTGEYSPVATQAYNGSQYLLFDKNTTWSEAQAFCEVLGGHLAYANTEEENEFIKTFVKNGQRGWYYLGGQKINGVWKWADGSKADAITWAPTADSWTGTNLMMYKSHGSCIGLRNAYYPKANLDLMGFVCEIESEDEPTPIATPVPASTPTPESITTPEPIPTPKSTPNIVVDDDTSPSVLTVFSGSNLQIAVDDKIVKFTDAKPFVDSNNRTQVPIRAVSEMLDCDVEWIPETHTAIVTRENGVSIIIAIGSDIMLVGGNKVTMDTSATVTNDRTYIPVRFVAEALGLTVKWE